ncbi:MAG TPA: hypothetical protein VJ852_13255 [Gemmatimonadaceae bacterium]|nr:hypothetical protein [Gemmatimonadaceae bacterium]
MDNSRIRLTAVLAGAALALFAVTSSAQNTNTPTTGGSAAPAADQSAAPQTGSSNAPAAQSPSTGSDAGATIGTSSRTTTTATDVTTTSPTTTTFWLSPWGLIAIAVVAILILWAIFGRRSSTVVRDSYTSSSTRNAGPTTERIVSPRAASGSETTTTRTTDTDTRM